MNVDPVQQKQALAIEGVLTNIFGYLIGHDIINSIVANLSMRLVSSCFNICFISYLRSAPLRLKYYSLEEGFRQRNILMWLIRHEITTITKLDVCISAIDVRDCHNDLVDFDLRHLESLTLSIQTKNPGRRYFNVENLLQLFAQGTTLINLELSDNTQQSAAIYENWLLNYPNLKYLDVNFGGPYPNQNFSPRMGEGMEKLEKLVRHDLCGNFSFSSDSVKVIDVSNSFLDSITTIHCPSLAVLACQNPVTIFETPGSLLVEDFGNSDKEFISNYVKSSPDHQVKMNEIDAISSISLLPFEQISNTTCKAEKECCVVLYTFDEGSL